MAQIEIAEDSSRLEHLLSMSTGDFYERGVAKAKAKKVAVQLRIVSHHSRAIAATGLKLFHVFQSEYRDLFTPRKDRGAVNWHG